MCGIAGVFDNSGTPAGRHAAVVERMLDDERHRGPDGQGLFTCGAAVLGHRRLSIIDLSDAGRQPMSNEDGSVHITFNGEIYNYRELCAPLRAAGHQFTSQCDTEVLVHGYEEWGIEGLLQRLRGMFAFAILDSRDATEGQRLLLARDRLGIKPLYYAAAGPALYFASEVRALRRNAPATGEIDLDAALGFLALGSIPSPATIYKGIRCLPPASYLTVSRGSPAIAIERYWDLRPHQQTGGGSAEELNRELELAVEQHLISDVPLGIFLSGGVDSAGLVALASRRHNLPLQTLTVTFDEQEYDESAPAREVARQFHTDHHEVRVASQEFIEEAPKILEAMDQPAHDGVNTYFVSRAARQAGLKVVLSGAGGDEVFWGYPHYRHLARSDSRWRRLLEAPAILRNILVFTGAAYGQARGKENWRRLEYLQERVSPGRVYLAARGFFPPAQIQRLLGIDSRELRLRTGRLLGVLEESGSSFPANSPESFNYLETQRYLHDQLLRDTDVFSMAHSIEARVPYLDHRIVEIAAGAAASRKLDGAVNKPMLVDAIHSPLIEKLSRAPKRGFTFPFQEWMRGHAAELAGMAGQGDCLDRNCVRELWEQQAAGRLHWSRAWSTVALAAVSGRK
jgi:asparagine synthase (glutamine-hydrolysing)